MKAPRFTNWFAALPTLNGPQRLRVLDALRPAAGLHQVLALIGLCRPAGRRCPHCRCERWHRHGHANDLQRYRCFSCRRTFNDLTGTPLARLRLRGKWLAYLDALLASRPVRAAAGEVNMHRNTAFRWRHRFLDRVKEDRPGCLNGITEADEMFILESQKGSRTLDRPARKRGGVASRRGISRDLDCILVARDRNKQTVDAVTGRGPVSKVQLERHLLPFLDRDVLLVTDANAAYRAFARAHGLAHQAVNVSVGDRVRPGFHGAIHVQNVNAYHQRLREWLAPFHGVASRWLPNYLGWRRMLDGGKVTSADQLFRLAIGLIHSKR
ncbi:IS1595 family transposase [Massilia sp. YIM B02769]|uniref:IS1595 family transposase n=1 Tax=Massilia sp. YIM B02769 TaxID=3050129 RepID=UPI0025B65A97|nr:IS1595 family transposase [Massilia sp. YIM B02769]MDN4060849.1 IS1595 family transposase [Massilia sp. YIM B02769]